MKDTEFFNEVSSVKGRMYKIAYSYFSSESMAVDAVDEAVYKGYLKKKQIKQPEFFETWLIRILLNVCNTQYRKNKKQTGLEELPETITTSEIDNIPLKEALRRLPSKYREIVLLKFFGGYTVSEIARLLDIPQGTVATRLSKSLSLLRLELSED